MTTGRINQVTTFTRRSPKRLYLLKHDATGNHPKSGNFQCTRSLRLHSVRGKSTTSRKLRSYQRRSSLPDLWCSYVSHTVELNCQYNVVKEMSVRERDKLQRIISPLAPLNAQPTFVNQYTHSATS